MDSMHIPLSKRKMLLVISFIFAIALIILAILSTFRYEAIVIVGEKAFRAEVADTQMLMEKGLSGHAPLEDDQGMLFVFDTPGNYGFWMKDMLYPIDIIWVGEDYKISHIEKWLFPDTYPEIYYPNVDSKYVLEVSGGQVDLLKFKIGDAVRITKKWL